MKTLETAVRKIADCSELDYCETAKGFDIHLKTDLAKIEAIVKAECDKAVKEASKSSTWRPIETAPKDGTQILVWCGDDEVRQVSWWWPTRWESHAYITKSLLKQKKEGGWLTNQCKFIELEIECPILFWQPVKGPK